VGEFEAYARAEGEEKHEASLRVDNSTLESVFGEGLPLKYIYHEFDGLTGAVTEYNFESPIGTTLVDRFRQSSASPERIAGAQAAVDAYEQQSAEIREKSQTLKRLLAPLDRINIQDRKALEEPVSDEDIEYAIGILGESNFWVGRSEIKQKRTIGAYLNLIEPSFGKLFRKYALQTVNSEDIARYKHQMDSALQSLVEAA
jgi:hypothetical protein